MTPLDTSPAAHDVQLNILRKMSGAERLRIAIDLSEFGRKLAFTRIEREHPGLSNSQLIREYLHCVLSEDDYPRGLR
jgi:hypothetical protein